MRFALRTASGADIDGLLALWQEAAENDGRPPDARAAVARLVSHDPDSVILAEHDGELIGSVVAGWDGWRCHLYRLAVRPDWRRQGVGTVLLGAAESRLRAVGQPASTLWCSPAMTSGRTSGERVATASSPAGAAG